MRRAIRIAFFFALVYCIIYAEINSRGNVFVLAGLYAFGVIWSFAFKALAVLVLRYTMRAKREWKVPGNLRTSRGELPIGLSLITLLLFLVAIANLFTKPDATIAGVTFSLVFFGIFSISEHFTGRRASRGNIEQFRVYSNPELNAEILRVRPGSVLVPIRDPRNLGYLRGVLARTDTSEQDVVVMTARLYHREHSFSGARVYDAADIFDEYEQELFTAVVNAAEKEGKTVSLLVAAGTDVFDTIMLTAQRLASSRVVCGISKQLSLDAQAKLTGDAWERMPEPKPRLVLEIVETDGRSTEFRLGPHTPHLREGDLQLLHSIWLDVTQEPRYSAVHHYHIVALALRKLDNEIRNGGRDRVRAELTQDSIETGLGSSKKN